jgi:hypothetical protein
MGTNERKCRWDTNYTNYTNGMQRAFLKLHEFHAVEAAPLHQDYSWLDSKSSHEFIIIPPKLRNGVHSPHTPHPISLTPLNRQCISILTFSHFHIFPFPCVSLCLRALVAENFCHKDTKALRCTLYYSNKIQTIFLFKFIFL